MLSYVLKNCRIADGSGRPAYVADVGIEGDTVAAIGRLDGSSAAEVMDLGGRVLAPGFIDLHSHSDLGALEHPLELNKLSQGVTTEVVGNCGFSLFPVTEAGRPAVRQMVKAYGKDFELPWSTGAEYRGLLGRLGHGFNYAPLVGHGMLRVNAMGFAARPASRAEREAMGAMLEAELAAGARGFSTGLGYLPGCFADTDELVHLAKVASRYGGVYASHIRDQGTGLLQSVAEAIRIGEEGGVPVIVSHLKAYGVSNWGMAGRALELIEAARSRGLAVMADFYPFEASSTTLLYELPEWAKAGKPEDIMARLRSPADRRRILDELAAKGEQSWDRVVVCAYGGTDGDCVGRSIAAIAERRGADAGETALDLLVEAAGKVETVSALMSEADVDLIATCPFTAVGSDGYALDAAAPFSGHPRNFGAFPRFLARYVRDKRLLGLEEAVRKTAALAAEFLGLRGRGSLAEGAYADLVAFNPETIDGGTDFSRPGALATGIEAVFVNGSLAYRGAGPTGARPGRALLSTGGMHE